MITVLKKFNILLNKQQKNRLIILFIITLIGAFFEVAGVSLMLPLLSALMAPDILETNTTIKRICEVLDIHSYRTFVIVCIVVLIAVFIIKDLFLMLEYYIQARFVYNNQFATQQKLLSKILSKPYEYFLNSESGELLRVIQNDVYYAFALLTTLIGMATETIVSLALVCTIFIISPMMTLFVGIMMIVMMIVITKVVKPILTQKGIERQKHSALAYKWIIQAITGIKEIKVSGKEEFFKKNYEASGRVYINAEKWNTVFSNTPRLLIEMVSVCSILSYIAISIYKGGDIENLIPSLGAFAMAAVKLMPSANRIVAAINQIAFQTPALDKLLKDMNLIDEKCETTKHIGMNGGDEIEIEVGREICLENISYRYPNNNKYVLKSANMSIPIGKYVGVVGKSGSGKTTAVDMILGLLKPESGKILYDGEEVMDNYKEWLSHIGYIPQSIFILDDSIAANVAFGLKPQEIDEKRLWTALKEAQLAELVSEMPEKADTKIGERGIRLSGGQRQRIGIARALYFNPEILIFDEATSALDGETEMAIMEAITSLKGKKTMIIIAHRLQTIENCDMVYRVGNGKITLEERL